MNHCGGAVVSEASLVAPAVLAAVVAASVSLLGLAVASRRGRVDRQRQLFAEAYADVVAYQEFVFIVRRRRADEPEAERGRISTALSEVQQSLNHHVAILRVEAPAVATVYANLVRHTRSTAGRFIRDGWDTPPPRTDAENHVQDVDLSSIGPYQDAFLVAMRDHLSPFPAWVRRTGRLVVAQVNRRGRTTRGGDEQGAPRVTPA